METAGRPHFGALLRQFRLDAGLTQQQLAERAKLSVEAISTLERGARTRPYRDTVSLLGRALGLSTERQALLGSAIGIPHATRQRECSEALNASLLRLVRPDAQATPGHNLPAQLTSFVGRQREIAEIAALLREHRLLTVVGAGGVGKTRIAVQTGSYLFESNPDGVWLVDLAPIADQTLMASAVLAALQLPSITGSPLDVVVAYLKTRRLLLILDNCEHVIAQVRRVATAIVEACPHVRVLATSREELDIRSEWVYRLSSLAVPSDSCQTAQDALGHDSVVLFVDRALAVNAGFVLTDDNAPEIGEICRRLDGIPLAIELAAARVKVLTPQQIAVRLDKRFRLLTGGDPRTLPRHQTMTALIDWSYDLLTSPEQKFFEVLSVFANGCTLAAVTAVCGQDDDEDDIAVIDLVSSLATKSLLVAELVGTEQRYRLLESSRQYARDKLIARNAQEDVARRHATFFVELAERFGDVWDTTSDRVWLPAVQAELGNWRATLEWTLTKRCDVVLGQRLCASREVLWRSFPLSEARRWVQTATEAIDERTPATLVAALEYAGAVATAHFAEHEATLAAAERALARYRDLGDALGIARAQSLGARSLAVLGEPEKAMPLLQEVLESARSINNHRFTAHTLQTMGIAAARMGDFVRARAWLSEALALAKATGAESLALSTVGVSASNEYDAGDFETALSLISDAIETYRALSSSASPGLCTALSDVAKYFIALGRYDHAWPYAKEAIEVAHGLRYVALLAISLQQIAVIALQNRPAGAQPTLAESTTAAWLFGFVEGRLTTLGIPEEYGLPHERDRALAVLREAIGADELARLMADGARMSEDEAIAHALALQ